MSKAYDNVVKLNNIVSVFDYMTPAQQQDVTSGTGALDVTAAINAAINFAKAIPFSEKEIVFPAGLYRVSQFNFTGVQLCTFRATGTVQIYGNGNADFVFGCDGYVSPGPGTTFSRSNHFVGGAWLIGNTGGTYNHAVKLTAMTRCTFENFGISGSVGAAAGADRIQCAINYCWVNTFVQFNVSSPGAPGSGFKSYCLQTGPLGANNVNTNTFSSCRITTGGVVSAPYSGQIGVRLLGNGNKFTACAVEALEVGYEIAGRGNVIDSSYHEGNYETCVKIFPPPAGFGLGTVIIGGIFEVVSNGSAFDLSSSENTTIIGGHYFGTGGGSNRTFIAQGNGCYGLNVIGPNLTNIDNYITGTYRGASTVSQPHILQAQWLSFPPTRISSTDANTLDDYEVGTFDPNIAFGTLGSGASVGVTYDYRQCSYTKVGNRVMVSGSISLTSKGSSVGNAQITGLPFSAPGNTNAYNAVAISMQKVSFADQYSAYVEIGQTYIPLYETTNAGVLTSLTNTDFADDSTILFQVTYRTDA